MAIPEEIGRPENRFFYPIFSTKKREINYFMKSSFSRPGNLMFCNWKECYVIKNPFGFFLIQLQWNIDFQLNFWRCSGCWWMRETKANGVKWVLEKTKYFTALPKTAVFSKENVIKSYPARNKLTRKYFLILGWFRTLASTIFIYHPVKVCLLSHEILLPQPRMIFT